MKKLVVVFAIILLSVHLYAQDNSTDTSIGSLDSIQGNITSSQENQYPINVAPNTLNKQYPDFISLGIKASIGVVGNSDENYRDLQFGIRFMYLPTVKRNFKLGLIIDAYWEQKKEKGHDEENFIGGNILVAGKFKLFFFGAGLNISFWLKPKTLTSGFRYHRREYYFLGTAGLITRGKTKFLIAFEYRIGLFSYENDNYSYYSEKIPSGIMITMGLQF